MADLQDEDLLDKQSASPKCQYRAAGGEARVPDLRTVELFCHNSPCGGKAGCGANQTTQYSVRIPCMLTRLSDRSEQFLNRRGLQFLQGFRFNLTDAFPCDGQALPHLLEGTGFIMPYAKS